ncbi:MAG TPA: ribonuclease HIII [Candidatus Cloacimonadota bacterium]|nr:ribonuclease HIII [Candidatus Cloacimonadota bacterium]
MHKLIENEVSHLIPDLERHGIGISSQTEIPWGLQLRLHKDAEQVVLNVYYSEKKGLSRVLGGKRESALYQELSSLLDAGRGKPAASLPLHAWQHWCGSDECGKGDYFGALVVAAFAVSQADLPRLQALGIMDSKRLSDPQIKEIAKQLYSEFPSAISCIVLKPVKYNEIYANMKSQGKNLNDLLAWQHGTVLSELKSRIPGLEGALVDQFSPSKKVQKLLKTKLPLFSVIERTGAEADIAVAAASIVARYQFVQTHEAMRRYYKLDFPFGANSKVKKTAGEFIAKYGFKRLGEAAKLHFVTTGQLSQQSFL